LPLFYKLEKGRSTGILEGLLSRLDNPSKARAMPLDSRPG